MERPPSAEIPDTPGAYLFRDPAGRVIYVGKAKSLRKRVGSYFSRSLSQKTQGLMDAAETVEWIVADNEVEALMLEYSLIKRHRPRFNIRMRDDKSYPYLAISRRDEWPAARVLRGKRGKGTEYFGPYAHAYAIRNTLDLLLKTFPVRTCSDAKYRRHEARGRPCLLADIEKCCAPCVGAVDADTYREYVDGLARFLEGDVEEVVGRLQEEMEAASTVQRYEEAARARDRLRDVEWALARQEAVSDRKENFDLLALCEAELDAAVVALRVRRGRVVGRLDTIIDKVEDLAPGELIGRVLRELYGGEEPPPRVLVAQLPPESRLWEEWLTERRGGRVQLSVPQRGSKRRLLQTTEANAAEALARNHLRRQGDPNARARALRSLQETLDLPQAPLRIEAYDISTIQGRHTVGSMVVLEDGLPRRSDYRRFEVKAVQGQDDFEAMEEVLRRRFQAYIRERERPVEERGKFAYPPSLVVIDGGVGQLGRAVRVLEDLGVDVPVVGLAKRLEEVFLPGTPEPLRIPRDEPALHLLQRARDEAHRFAVSYHRTLRGQRMVDSILDDVPGVGPSRKNALLRKFGSLKRMRSAAEGELAEVVPRTVAADLYAALHG